MQVWYKTSPRDDEGDIEVCGIAVLDNFSCGISVILILNCGIAVFSKSAGCGFLAFWTGYKILLQVLQRFRRAFSSFRSFHFLLIISQHATGCSLFCLFCLNRTFPNLNFCFRVICSQLNVQCSGFSMTSSFDTVL